jgi:hypothetical protein
MLISALFGGPTWVTVFFACVAGVFGLAMIGAFFLFAKKDPDLLRSEKFSIRKFELQHQGLVGDSRTGLVEPAPVEVVADATPPALPTPDEGADEH